MAIDWDAEVTGPLMSEFGEAGPENPAPIAYSSTRSGRAFNVNGVFDAGHAEAFTEEGVPISTRVIVLGVQLSSFPGDSAPKQRDQLVIKGDTYVVGDVQPDSHGWALLKLNLLEASSS